MLTERQVLEFRRRGVLRLAGFLPEAVVAPARDRALERLAGIGVYRDGVWRCDAIDRPSWPDGGLEHLRSLKKAREFKGIACQALIDTMSALAGEPLHSIHGTPQLLFTLPNADHWHVPSSVWHLDFPHLPDGECPGVQFFTFLTDVRRGGGGTLVVAGSHRLFNDGRRIGSKQLKRMLKQVPWFRELMSRGEPVDRERFLQDEADVCGVDVQVVELHGRPGDVYLVDPRVLHTLAPNTTSVPRVMLTDRYFRTSAWDEFMSAFGEREVPQEPV